MASVLKVKKNHYTVRSISLPSRSHPSTVSVEEELSKIKSWETTTSASTSTSTSSLGSIQSGLDGLVNLYLSLDDLLNMASTQQVLSINKIEKCMDELLDGSVKLLDICGITRELVLQIKEHVRVLQSALRRRKADSSIETSIQDYANFRKKLKKDAKKLVGELKQMDNNLGSSSSSLLEQDDHLVAVLRVLREANVSSSFMLQSLLSLLSATSSKTKETSKWSIVSRLVHKGAIASEEKLGAGNELASIDASLYKFNSNEAIDTRKIQIMQKQLESVDISIASLDDCLECIFRRFIKTRSSLLNIISH